MRPTPMGITNEPVVSFATGTISKTYALDPGSNLGWT